MFRPPTVSVQSTENDLIIAIPLLMIAGSSYNDKRDYVKEACLEHLGYYPTKSDRDQDSHLLFFPKSRYTEEQMWDFVGFMYDCSIIRPIAVTSSLKTNPSPAKGLLDWLMSFMQWLRSMVNPVTQKGFSDLQPGDIFWFETKPDNRFKVVSQVTGDGFFKKPVAGKTSFNCSDLDEDGKVIPGVHLITRDKSLIVCVR